MQIDPCHTHILLYLTSYDTKQTLYAIQTLKNIIFVDKRLFLWASLTTGISSSIRQLLEKHRRSIDGREDSEPSSANPSKKSGNSQYSYRGCMYFEAIVIICIYHSRSYFQHRTINKPAKDVPTAEEIADNFKIQIECIELLTALLNELIVIVKEMGKGLSNYIADLMKKCRIQKVVLHELLTSVNAITNKSTTTQFILHDPTGDLLYAESIQLQLLRLLTATIKLEYEVRLQVNEDAFKEIFQNSPTRLMTNVPTNAKYLSNYTVPQQPMFMAAVINALQSESLKFLHKSWTSAITTCLYCFTGGSLTNIVINVVHQLCNNLDKFVKNPVKIPVNYAASQMEALTTLCHHCLLDNSQQESLTTIFGGQASFFETQTSSSGQILNSLVSVFIASASQAFLQTPNKSNSHHIAAKNAVLSHLPRIIGSIAGLWEHEHGQTRNAKQQLFEFINPICLHHTANFLTALAVAWHDRKDKEERERRGSEQHVVNYLPQSNADQMMLIKLVGGVRTLQMDLFIRILHAIIKTPPTIYNPPQGWNMEISGLELFYFYLMEASATSLPDAWPSLLGLLKDGLSSSPQALFIHFAILSTFVQRCPQMPFQDRKDLRELHDITSKLVDAMSMIAGANLEQTTWLRRNLAVREDSDMVLKEGVVAPQYPVQAQSILAVLLANLLDVAYGSLEKDKVVTIVTTLMYNIVPYLKNHTTRNVPSFYACSSLLANLSGYQNTRKAWRKDVLDLLLDPAFFQMDTSCLSFWKTIMDNLMTYDNMSAFKELMSKLIIFTFS